MIISVQWKGQFGGDYHIITEDSVNVIIKPDREGGVTLHIKAKDLHIATAAHSLDKKITLKKMHLAGVG